MSRSTVLAVICLFAIAGSVAWFVFRPDSPAEKARASAERRKCCECGYEWSKDRAELIRESKNAPPGLGQFVQCPKCKAWAGSPLVRCENCGRNFTVRMIVMGEDGVPLSPKQRECPYCRTPLGSVGTEEPPVE